MTITTDNYEQYLFRYAEGDLSSDERSTVEVWLAQHPEASEELENYLACPPLPPAPIPYPDKGALRLRATVFAFPWRYAAAACVALLLGMGIWRYLSNTKDEPVLMRTGTSALPMMAENRNFLTIAKRKQPAVRLPKTITRMQETCTPAVSYCQDACTPEYDISSMGEMPTVAEVPTHEEETVVIIYEEILVPCTIEEPVLAWVEVDSTYSPTLADRLEDWSSQYTCQFYSQYQMARAKVLTSLSRRPF